jgi:hypothetical protein
MSSVGIGKTFTGVFIASVALVVALVVMHEAPRYEAMGTFRTQNLQVDDNDVFGGSHVATVRVDLARTPYSVVTGSTGAAAANMAGIRQAIADFCGTRARLVLPPGVIYVGQDGINKWSINFPSTCTDVQLFGYGMFSTMLAQFGAGTGGEWDLIVVNGTRIELAEFGMYQDTITTPDPGQQNHLLANYDGATDVYGHNLSFGKSIGDELRFAAGAGTINNLHYTELLFHGHGTVTSAPPNGRVGSRSGVALQRGPNNVELDHFYIDGVQNSAIDEEPSGGAGSRVYIHDGFVDNSNSLGSMTSVGVSIGGESGGARSQYERFEQMFILNGELDIAQTDNLVVDDVTIVETAAFPANPHDVLALVRQTNNNIQLRNLHLERVGTSDTGGLLDMENAGGVNANIEGGTYIQGVVGQPILIDASNNTLLHGLQIKYTAGAGAASFTGITFRAIDGNSNNPQFSNITVQCSTGKLQSGVYIQVRGPRTMNGVSVSGLNANGAASNCFQTSLGVGGTLDSTPLLGDVSCGSGDTVWFAGDAGDNPVTTLYPILGNTSVTATPAISSCGGAGAAIVGINEWGYITEGAAATGCTITFDKPFTNRPSCTLVSEDALGFTYTVTNTSLTITNVGALSGKNINYQCHRV